MTQPDLPGDGRIVVLAGPGVLEPPEGRGVRGLRSFAAAGDLGVANTWGAKGVFDWDSPHHLGTCGLQARDFELLGWAGADVIVATGVDDAESPRERFALAPVLDVDPDDLDARAGTVRSTGPPLINDLYARLAAIAQPGFVDDRVPLHPARAVADLGAALPTGGLLSADPGPAGLWVARTFPTPAVTPGGPRRVVVPAVTVPGTAARAASDAARAQRPAIIVTTDPVDPATAAVFDDLSAAGAAVVLVVWGERGRLERVGQHRERLDAALTATGAAVVEIPVDFSCTELLVDAAGPVIAWPGLADDRLR
ncbi:MAG: hypothetical protein R6X23_05745 [Acidimicrobiia bacterium]